jgi:hypothetical protein
LTTPPLPLMLPLMIKLPLVTLSYQLFDQL